MKSFILALITLTFAGCAASHRSAASRLDSISDYELHRAIKFGRSQARRDTPRNPFWARVSSQRGLRTESYSESLRLLIAERNNRSACYVFPEACVLP